MTSKSSDCSPPRSGVIRTRRQSSIIDSPSRVTRSQVRRVSDTHTASPVPSRLSVRGRRSLKAPLDEDDGTHIPQQKDDVKPQAVKRGRKPTKTSVTEVSSSKSKSEVPKNVCNQVSQPVTRRTRSSATNEPVCNVDLPPRRMTRSSSASSMASNSTITSSVLSPMRKTRGRQQLSPVFSASFSDNCPSPVKEESSPELRKRKSNYGQETPGTTTHTCNTSGSSSISPHKIPTPVSEVSQCGSRDSLRSTKDDQSSASSPLVGLDDSDSSGSRRTSRIQKTSTEVDSALAAGSPTSSNVNSLRKSAGKLSLSSSKSTASKPSKFIETPLTDSSIKATHQDLSPAINSSFVSSPTTTGFSIAPLSSPSSTFQRKLSGRLSLPSSTASLFHEISLVDSPESPELGAENVPGSEVINSSSELSKKFSTPSDERVSKPRKMSIGRLSSGKPSPGLPFTCTVTPLHKSPPKDSKQESDFVVTETEVLSPEVGKGQGSPKKPSSAIMDSSSAKKSQDKLVTEEASSNTEGYIDRQNSPGKRASRKEGYRSDMPVSPSEEQQKSQEECTLPQAESQQLSSREGVLTVADVSHLLANSKGSSVNNEKFSTIWKPSGGRNSYDIETEPSGSKRTSSVLPGIDSPTDFGLMEKSNKMEAKSNTVAKSRGSSVLKDAAYLVSGGNISDFDENDSDKDIWEPVFSPSTTSKKERRLEKKAQKKAEKMARRISKAEQRRLQQTIGEMSNKDNDFKQQKIIISTAASSVNQENSISPSLDFNSTPSSSFEIPKVSDFEGSIEKSNVSGSEEKSLKRKDIERNTVQEMKDKKKKKPSLDVFQLEECDVSENLVGGAEEGKEKHRESGNFPFIVEEKYHGRDISLKQDEMISEDNINHRDVSPPQKIKKKEKSIVDVNINAYSGEGDFEENPAELNVVEGNSSEKDQKKKKKKKKKKQKQLGETFVEQVDNQSEVVRDNSVFKESENIEIKKKKKKQKINKKFQVTKEEKSEDSALIPFEEKEDSSGKKKKKRNLNENDGQILEEGSLSGAVLKKKKKKKKLDVVPNSNASHLMAEDEYSDWRENQDKKNQKRHENLQLRPLEKNGNGCESDSDAEPSSVSFAASKQAALAELEAAADSRQKQKEQKREKNKLKLQKIMEERKLKKLKLKHEGDVESNSFSIGSTLGKSKLTFVHRQTEDGAAVQTKPMKRLPAEVLESLSEQRPSKVLKLSSGEVTAVNISDQEKIRLERKKAKRLALKMEKQRLKKADYIPLDGVLGSTRFGVVPLRNQMLARKFEKQRLADEAAQEMVRKERLNKERLLNRVRRTPISTILAYNEKLKASGKDRLVE